MHHVIALHYKVYGKTLNIEQLKNKYKPMGPFTELFGHLAFEGDIAIGFIGVVLVPLEFEGAMEWSGFFLDAMTLPERRSWVLFVKLLHANYEILQDAGISSAWSNSSPQSGVLYTPRGKWTAAHPIQAYRIPVMNPYMAKTKRLLAKALGQDANHVFRNSISAPSAYHSFQDQDVVRVCRDDSFMDYKKLSGGFFVNNKHRTIWLKDLFILCIGDIELHRAQDLDELMEWLIPSARKVGAPEIIFQTSPGSFADECFSRKYISFPSWTIGYYNFNSKFPLDKLRFTWGDLDTF